MTQYQSIISELKGEIGRLKEKIDNEPVKYSPCNQNTNSLFQGVSGNLVTKQQMEELKVLRDALVSNFKDQMKLR